MSLSLARIAEMVGGQLSEDTCIEIHGAAILRDATDTDITLADNPKLADALTASQAAAVIVPHDFRPAGAAYVAVDDPRTAFAKIVTYFRPTPQRGLVGVSPSAHIDSTARIGSDTVVYPGATICADVQIGNGCVVHPGVTIMDGSRIADNVTVFAQAVLYENTVVGARSVIHAAAVLGAYGFGYEMVDGKHQRCPQLGYVEVGQDVEIGAGTTIDRGTYGPTVIGDGTKVDDQVMIGHNCRIGKHNLLCSQVGIAGSVTTGDYVVMAGQVGLRDHVTIGDRAMIGAKSGVSQDLPPDEKYLGSPALPARAQMQIYFAQQKLPKMLRQLRQLQNSLDELTAANEQARRPDAA